MRKIANMNKERDTYEDYLLSEEQIFINPIRSYPLVMYNIENPIIYYPIRYKRNWLKVLYFCLIPIWFITITCLGLIAIYFFYTALVGIGIGILIVQTTYLFWMMWDYEDGWIELPSIINTAAMVESYKRD